MRFLALMVVVICKSGQFCFIFLYLRRLCSCMSCLLDYDGCVVAMQSPSLFVVKILIGLIGWAYD